MGEFPSRVNQFTAEYQPDNRGRPKGSLSLSSLLRRLLECEITIMDPILNQVVRKSVGEIIVLKLVDNALKGNMKAINDIFDRVEGKPTQSKDFDLNEPHQLTIEIVHVVKETKKIISEVAPQDQ